AGTTRHGPRNRLSRLPGPLRRRADGRTILGDAGRAHVRAVRQRDDEARHDLVRPGAGARRVANSLRLGQAVAAVFGDRLVAGGRAGRQLAAEGERIRRAAGDRQSRADAARFAGRLGHPPADRRDAGGNRSPIGEAGDRLGGAATKAITKTRKGESTKKIFGLRSLGRSPSYSSFLFVSCFRSFAFS